MLSTFKLENKNKLIEKKTTPKMKLLRIYKKEESYIVEALDSVKIFNLKLREKEIIFKGDTAGEAWTYVSGKKKASRKQHKILHSWIRDHKRFLE